MNVTRMRKISIRPIRCRVVAVFNAQRLTREFGQVILAAIWIQQVSREKGVVLNSLKCDIEASEQAYSPYQIPLLTHNVNHFVHVDGLKAVSEAQP